MTIVGRSQIDHPALGTAGGSALHAAIETIYTNIGNDLAGRYETAASIANSAVTTFTHNFGVQFSDLKILLYTGTHPNLTRVSDPVASGWTIAATSGFVKTQIDVTAPSSGGPHTFALMVTHGRGAEKLSDLDDIDFSPAPASGQLLTFNGTSWEPKYLTHPVETVSITTNTITPTLGTTVQRITGSAADLQMIAAPVSGKQYIIINETGSSVTIKNDTGATAANRIYTGTGADATLANQAATTLVYDSGLSRWVISGGGSGGGGGGLAAFTVITGATTATASSRYLANTTSSAFTLTLPASPSVGDEVQVNDQLGTWETNNLTIGRNGQSIASSATDLVCDVSNSSLKLVFVGSTVGWGVYT